MTVILFILTLLGTVAATFVIIGVALIGYLTNYLLTAIGVAKIAKRTGYASVGAAWAPIARYWALGKLGDKFAEEEYCKKRKFATVLLVFAIIAAALLALWVFLYVLTFLPLVNLLAGFLNWFVFPAVTIAFLALRVLQIIGMFRVYKMCRPSVAVLFLVLGLVFLLLPLAEIFLLFCNAPKASEDGYDAIDYDSEDFDA